MQGDAELGRKLRELRKTRRITLQELAARCGLSASFISQVERGLVSPSIAALKKLAKSLEIPMGYLFGSEPSEGDVVVRRDKRKRLLLPHLDVTYELLTPNLVNKKAEFVLITIDPKTYTPKKPLAHEGEEYGLVLKGTAKVTLGAKEYILSEGDSIWFQALQPHMVDSYGDEETVLVWVLTPPGWT
ncbi:MAG: cupin domain-containing protein [Bacillota bacterium]|nr:cupin domain-containing protein [Bacillota bacterium]